MKYFALDIGDRYIGIATTDHVTESLVYRYGTIDRKVQNPFVVLRDMIQKESVDALVLGIPYHVEDGSETAQTRNTKEFIAFLKETFGSLVTYIEVDETLTSFQAKENLKNEQIGMNEEHAEAARVMLQEYLVSKR
jgi:putative holliday junction resolvase